MKISNAKFIALLYHQQFDYPLTSEELEKWQYGKVIKIKPLEVYRKDQYFYLDGNKKLLDIRKKREQVSDQKRQLAQKAADVLGRIPLIKMVGMTGSLAMLNAKSEADVDLMIITKKDSLWVARMLSYLLLITLGFKLRIPGVKKEKNRLCLNLWLDESDLAWPEDDRNLYTAHEVAQVIPLVNKNKTHELFLWQNRWFLDYWPKSVKIRKVKPEKQVKNLNILLRFINQMAYNLQYLYMRKKITKEVVTFTQAIFHPTKPPLDKFFDSFVK